MEHSNDSNQSLEKALVEWLNTFEGTSRKLTILLEVKDAIFLNELMTHVSPKFLPPSLCHENVDNWTVCFKNLGDFYQHLEAYFTDVLGLATFDPKYVEIMPIVKNGDQNQLIRLIEVVMAAVLLGETKEKYVTMISTLSESAQNKIWPLVEQIAHRYNEPAGSPGHHGDSGRNSLYNMVSPQKMDSSKEVSELITKVDEMESENGRLKAHIKDLEDEKENFVQRLSAAIEDLNRKDEEIKQVQTSMERMMAKFNMGESDEDFRNEIKHKDLKISEQEKLITEMRTNYEEKITALDADLRAAKMKAKDVGKYESALEVYKSQLEEIPKLTKQVAELEETNRTLKRTSDESETTTNLLNTRLAKYKEQMDAEKKKNINLDIQLARKATEIENLKREKKDYEAAVEDNERRIQDLITQVDKLMNEKGGDGGMRSLSHDLHEYVQLLEKENQALKDKHSQEANLEARGNEAENIKFDTDLEILKKENEVLREKLLESEKECQQLKAIVDKSEDMKTFTTLTKENTQLREDLMKMRASVAIEKNNEGVAKELQAENARLKELQAENTKLAEELKSLKNKLDSEDGYRLQQEDREINQLKDTVNDKIAYIRQLNEKITALEGENSKQRQNIADEAEKYNQVIYQTRNELDLARNNNLEIIEAKDEELRLMTTAIHFLINKFVAGKGIKDDSKALQKPGIKGITYGPQGGQTGGNAGNGHSQVTVNMTTTTITATTTTKKGGK